MWFHDHVTTRVYELLLNDAADDPEVVVQKPRPKV
jgi:hypothetical protein